MVLKASTQEGKGMKPHHVIWAFVAGQAQLESALDLLRRAGVEATEVSLLAPYERLERLGRSMLAPGNRKRPKARKTPLEWLDRKGIVDISPTGPLVAAGDWLTTLLEPDAQAALQRIADCARTLVPAPDGRSNHGGMFPYILIAVTCPESERLARAVGVLRTVSDSVFPAEALGIDSPTAASPVERLAEDLEPYSDLYNGAVARVMDRDVPYVNADTPLTDALHAMRGMGEAFLPVVDGDKMVGLLTNSQVPARPVGVNGSQPALVRDAMIADFVYCFDDDELGQAAQTMEKSQVTRVPVLDRTGKLVGMVRPVPPLDARVYEPHLTD